MSKSKSTAIAAPAVMRIKPELLLGIYGIIPVVALFLALDWWLNGWRLSRSLPSDPHSMQWFTMFFMLPHIFASLFTFLDREYLEAYKERLVVSVPLILVALLASPLMFNGALIRLVVAVYTIFHLVSQQTGIAAMVARNKSRAYHAWKWLSFLVIMLISVVAQADVPALQRGLAVAFPGFLLVYGGLTWVVARQSKTTVGAGYISANSLMIVVCYGLALVNLPFFVILIPRVVHDVTAFYFYISHNSNRNRERPMNWVSRLRSGLRLPEYVFTPLLGVLCTALVTATFGEYIFFTVFFLGLLHYYWEGIMWKQGSPHRANIFV